MSASGFTVESAAGLAPLRALEARLVTILPELYQESYETVAPVSMGSAGLKYGPDGKVAWGDIWQSFCDLAMAGGPPHKGTLLRPGTRVEIHANPDAYQRIADEICRGIGLAAELRATPSDRPGWIAVQCADPGMAAWLERAILMENVSACSSGDSLYLPAGPAYHVEKEVKNVITSIAKTCHYWMDHMWPTQHRTIAALFKTMEAEFPLVRPGLPEDDALAGTRSKLSRQLQNAGLPITDTACGEWFGVHCPSVAAAVWMMRALVASNVLARREDTTLLVPVNPQRDPAGEDVAAALIRVHGFAAMRGVL